MKTITAFLDFLDNRMVFRRVILLATFAMTWRAVDSAWLFAASSRFDGLGTAAVIAAVAAPLSAVQAFAFREYSQVRSNKGATRTYTTGRSSVSVVEESK